MHAECPADLARLIDAVRRVAHTEIMPRYLQVTHDHKGDGSWLTAADVAAQLALSRELAEIADAPLLGEEMSSITDPWRRMEIFIEVCFEIVRNTKEYYQVNMDFWTQINQKEEIRKVIATHYSKFREAAAAVIQDGVDKG
ncbi:MAG: hypothetical protein EBV57_09240, partial [Betaproteobacteria bacterium]|nr:hypothetical protein [Betaproteobacteria bacterium]